MPAQLGPALAAAALCCLAGGPAQAKVRIYGSALKAHATIVEAHPVDSAFWWTRLSGGRPVRAPATGQVLAVRIRGTVRRRAGAPKPDNTIFFQHLRPRSGGRMRVLQTSQPFHLRVGGDPDRISIFRPVNLCARRGDVIAFNDIGGFTADYPGGAPFAVFGRVPGAATARHTGNGALMNDAIFGPTATRAGSELLMQLWLGTGANVSGACRAYNAAN